MNKKAFFVAALTFLFGVTGAWALDEVDGVYQINNGEDLVAFSELVNGGQNQAQAVMNADIDMTGYSEQFMPIGSDEFKYSGTFDGQGHTISNLKIFLEQDYVGLFGVVETPALIRGIILDETCHLETTGNYCGIVGVIRGAKGDVNLQNLGMEGEVVLGGKNGGGVLGNNMDNAAYPHLKNCYMTGTVSANTNSALLVGYAGDGGSYESCWGTGEVLKGLGGEDNYLIRSASNSPFTNCFSKNGNQGNVTTIEDGWLESGELCYRLNGKSFVNPGFYQKIGEDKQPVFDPSHGIVYQSGTEFATICDEASFADFRYEFILAESEYLEELVAEQALIEKYAESLKGLEASKNMDEFLEMYNDIYATKQLLESSSKAYVTYQNTMDDIIAYLMEHDDFFGEKREYLESYLNDYIQPDGNTFPYGSFAYIMEVHTLSEAEIVAETEKIVKLRDEAISEGFEVHSDITSLLVDSDFSDGYNGWEGKAGTGTNSPVAECKNATCDYYQTITGLRDGVYELRANGFFRPGNASDGNGNVTGTNYGAFIYTNDVQNYIMACIEDMVTLENAIDGVNCIIEGSNNDRVIYSESDEILGYVPSGQTGLKVASSAGRYLNRVLVYVTGGTLTVGIRVPGTGVANDCMDIGRIKLYYHGTKEDASEQIDATLAAMAARANTLVESVPSSGNNYAEYPNFSNELRAELSQAIAAVATTSGVEEQYALIEHFSDLFQQVYDNKKVFVGVMDAAMSLVNLVSSLDGIVTEEELDKIYDFADELAQAYTDGTATADMADFEKAGVDISFIPKMVGGVYQIENGLHLSVFSSLVQGGDLKAKAVLVNDIDMAEYSENFESIGSDANRYAGTFDGQGHKISNLKASHAGDYGGLFGVIQTPAVIRGIVLDATCQLQASGNYCGIVGAIKGDKGDVYLENLGMEGDVILSGKNGGGILGNNQDNAAYPRLKNCYMTGNVSASSNSALLVGYAGDGGSYENCWGTGEVISGLGNEDNYLIRSASNSPFTNNYSKFGTQSNVTIIEEGWTESGELCYLLNGDQSEISWYQNLGEDLHPVFDPTHGIVVKNEDGSYTTGLEAVIASETNTQNKVYDLQGRSISNGKLSKGIYVINGKKVLVK